MFEHEKLLVWRKSNDLAIELRALADSLPPRMDDLADQLRRSVSSVALNLAEGANEFSPVAKAAFYRIARRSAGETAAVLAQIGPLSTPPLDVSSYLARLSEVIALTTRLILAMPRKR